MTDPDRGAYTPPTDAPLAFDARRPTLSVRRPFPFSLILGILVLAAMVAAVAFFYRSGVRGAGDAPQPVGTPIGDITAPAPAEAQPADPAAGLEIYKTETPAAAGAPTFSAPPEQPQARPTTPVQTAAIPPVQIASAQTAPKPLAVTPVKPAPVAVVAPTPAPKPAAPPPVATTTPGAFVVQIGALSTPELADKAWKQAVALPGGSGKGKSVSEVEVNGATLYRTAVTGFTTKESAIAFCEAFKATGKGCFVR